MKVGRKMNIAIIIISQVIGIIAWILLFYSYYKEDINKVLFIQIISALFYSVSYFLLGAWSGLLVCTFELLKAIAYYKSDKDKLIFFITLPIYLVIAYFTYNGFISILPTIDSIIVGFAFTYDKKIATIGSIISSILWIAYDIEIYAFAQALTDGISNLFILIKGSSFILKNKIKTRI